MVFLLHPGGKFLLCPDSAGHLVSLGTHMEIIRGGSIAGKAVRPTVKFKSKEDRVVAYVFHSVAGEIGVSTEHEIYGEHGA